MRSFLSHYQDKLFIPALLFGLIFLMAVRTPLDSDMWWHLKSGEVMLNSRTPLTNDIFSYTENGQTWINHSWLAQVCMYVAYKAGGFYALGGMTAFIVTMSLALVYLQLAGPPLQKAFLLVLAAVVSAPVWSPRPQILSLLFLGIISFITYRFRQKKSQSLWWLLPVFVLWSNMHGGYVLGFLFLGSIILGELVGKILNIQSLSTMSRKKIGQLIFFSIASGFFVLLNPNGIDTWIIPFKTVGVEALQQFIPEWASPDFHQLFQQPLLWLVFALIGVLGISKQPLKSWEFFVIVIFGYLAFIARRNFGPFAIVATPILSRHLAGFTVNKINRRQNQKPKWGRWFERVILGLVIIAGFAKWYIVTEPKLVHTYENALFPASAVEWIKLNQPQGELFNAYNWGGYLIWQLPDYPVFIDGRTDLYEDLFQEYLLIYGGEAKWDDLLRKRLINLVLVETNSELAQVLSRNEKWAVRYQDGLASVFARIELGSK